MQNMKDEAIDALNELRDDAEKIIDHPSLVVWKNNATLILENIYGENSTPVKSVAKLRSWRGFDSWESIQENRKVAVGLIDGLISGYEKFGSPKFSPKAESGITLNLTQNQTTTVKLYVVIESMQKVLNTDQFKELQDLFNSDSLVGEEKKSKIFEKLKSFGSDIVSNILANILTNPNLYS